MMLGPPVREVLLSCPISFCRVASDPFRIHKTLGWLIFFLAHVEVEDFMRKF